MIESHKDKEIKRKIDQYVSGQLSPEEVEELWLDLIQDEYHLDYLKTVANVYALQDNTVEDQGNIFYLNRSYWKYAAAAVIVLLVAVLTILNYPVLQTSSEIQPIEDIELDYYRSDEGIINSENPQVIRRAIELANSGELSQAIDLLQNELEIAKESIWIAELSLNIGSLQYNAGRYDKAVESFERVIKQPNIEVLTKERAYWFLGNAYFQQNHLDKAQEAIQKAYDLNGAYRRVAGSYLNALSK